MDDLVIVDIQVRKLLDKASKITKENYDDYSIHSLICAVEDLIYDYEYLEDEIKDMEQDIEDNYKRITRAEEINYNHYDFL